MRARLSNQTLARLPASVTPPGYDRASVTPGIVHLGVGAFHRAHQASYVDDCLAGGESGWGIVGASLRSAGTRDALGPQDGLYALAARSSEGENLARHRLDHVAACGAGKIRQPSLRRCAIHGSAS